MTATHRFLHILYRRYNHTYVWVARADDVEGLCCALGRAAARGWITWREAWALTRKVRGRMENQSERREN